MKTINVRYFILVCLLLALTVQVFNTSNLYMSFSNLTDPYRTLAGYFIGISAEFSIFICILAGSRAAGGWFAIITFFCGILFHNHWNEVQFDWINKQFYFPTPFLSSTLLQLMNSVLVWFLSELYIEKQKAITISKSIAELEQQNRHLEQLALNQKEQIKNYEVAISAIEYNYKTMNSELSEWESKRDRLKQEITTLQKTKAGMSR